MKNRPLNILRVITWLPVGGIERKILAVLPRLDPEKFRVRLVCLRERGVLADALEAAGVPVDVCKMQTRLSPSGLRTLSRYMKEHEIDLVHAHMYRSSVPATVAARMAGVPVMIGQVHNVDTWETMRQRVVDRFLCRWRSAMVAVSERVRKDVEKNLRLPHEKVHVIYNGVEIGRFSDKSLRDEARAGLGLKAEDVAIVYHGRLVNQKNPESFLRIAGEIAQTRRGVRMIVVGDGPRREDLERSAVEQGLGDSIQFLGRRDDIPALLQAADIAVSPSFKEGFSNSLMESMASGLAIVATDVGGNAEAIENGKSGLIVPPHEDDLLLDAVARLVDDAELRNRMGEGARQRAERFSLDRMVVDVESLYESLAHDAGLI